MPKFDYATIKDLDQPAISAKIRSGEVKVPKDKEARDEFFKFASASDEDRVKMLPQQQPAASPEPPKPPEQSVPTPAPEAPKPPEPSEPEWKRLGYESEAEAFEALKRSRELVDEQKSTIDRFNAERGMLGRKVKELEEKVATIDKPKPPQEPSKPTPKAARPKRPVEPDPGEFDDGVYDKKYKEARQVYLSNMEKWEDQFASWLHSESGPPKEIEELTKKVDEATEFVKANRTQAATAQIASQWGAFWDKEVATLQSKFGLKTTTSPRSISDDWATLSDSTASMEMKKQAKTRLDSLPKSDHDVYAKIKQLAETRFDFSSGTPVSRYRSWEGAASDNGISLEPAARKAPLPPPPDDTIRAPSSADMVRGDGHIADLSDSEATAEYSKLLLEYQQATKLGKGAEWTKGARGQKFNELRTRLGVARRQ
jgi:hypothetical protein